MSKNKKDVEALTLAERIEGSLNGFLAKNKKLIIIVAAVIAVTLITLGIVTAVNNKNLQAQFNTIDQLEETYSSLVILGVDGEGYQAKYDALVADLNDLASKGNKYPSLKANYLLGVMSFEKKDYQKAFDTFVSVYNNAGKNYLASLALTNAAVTAEEMGNDSLALEYFTKVIDVFGFTAAESAKALFGQARLQEKSGNLELAKAIFQQLADQFPTSEFGRLATNRLAFL